MKFRPYFLHFLVRFGQNSVQVMSTKKILDYREFSWKLVQWKAAPRGVDECLSSYSKTNKMHQFLKLFILVKHSTCFGRFSTHHQELKTAHTATGICQTAAAASGDEMELEFHLVPASKQVVAAVWRIPVAVCVVLSSWWWAERPSETCRVFYKNK